MKLILAKAAGVLHGAFGVPGINATIARGAHAFPPRDATRGKHAPENRSEAADASADPDC
ncbi:hypothetical protein [Caballeronia novacaledonica]|uniref:hypothetical protein n=1 Tax=Caballeronia novacaledonica TaxID=1544861 RepID=UPI0011B1F880|nr:hypothetical protein [Caballeronia novacaledonica]